jgi:hypothetical protein
MNCLLFDNSCLLARGKPQAKRDSGVVTIDGSEPMQNDQAYFFNDIFFKFYNIIEL